MAYPSPAVPNILALGRGAEIVAERLFAVEEVVQGITLVVSIVGILADSPWNYYLGIIGLLIQLGAILIRRRAATVRGHGRAAMRRATLIGATLLDEMHPEVLEIGRKAEAVPSIRSTAAEWYEDWRSGKPVDPPWWELYWRTRDKQPALRLGDMSLESSIWWAHLSARAELAASIRLLIVVCAVAAVAGVGWYVQAGITLGDVLVQIGLWVLAADATSVLVRWRTARIASDDLLFRVRAEKTPDLSRSLLWFADYVSLTTAAPPIPKPLVRFMKTRDLEAVADKEVDNRALARERD